MTEIVEDVEPHSDISDDDDELDFEVVMQVKAPVVVPKQASALTKPRLEYKQLNVDGNASVLEVDLDTCREKPWQAPGTDLTDYFNYGFNERSWKVYRVAALQERGEYPDIQVLGSATTPSKMPAMPFPGMPMQMPGVPAMMPSFMRQQPMPSVPAAYAPVIKRENVNVEPQTQMPPQTAGSPPPRDAQRERDDSRDERSRHDEGRSRRDDRRDRRERSSSRTRDRSRDYERRERERERERSTRHRSRSRSYDRR